MGKKKHSVLRRIEPVNAHVLDHILNEIAEFSLESTIMFLNVKSVINLMRRFVHLVHLVTRIHILIYLIYTFTLNRHTHDS